MKAFEQYWTFSVIRGVLTMIAAVGIVALPQAAAGMLSIPVVVALGVNVMAVYCMFDGGVMVLLEMLLPVRAAHRELLYRQAAMGGVAGTVMFLVTFGTLPAIFAILAAAVQAAVAAWCEWNLARDHKTVSGRTCGYATAAVLGACAMVLPAAARMSATRMSFALGLYVAAYGVCELMTGARGLFGMYRAEHPAAALSMAWQDAMEDAGRQGAVAYSDCTGCPAEALCHDESTAGQVARLMAGPEPLIVRSVRTATVLQMEPAAKQCAEMRRSA